MDSNHYNSRLTRSHITLILLILSSLILPSIAPVQVIMSPASYTIGSHVPIFLALLLSPTVAIIVGLSSILGFILANYPLAIIIRSCAHFIFILIANKLLSTMPNLLDSRSMRLSFNSLINLMHAAIELAITFTFTAFNFSHLALHYWVALFSTVGLVAFIQGCFEFIVAYYLAKLIQKSGILNFQYIE